jgi:rRNA maturation endonuclease Nob1
MRCKNCKTEFALEVETGGKWNLPSLCPFCGKPLLTPLEEEKKK